MSTLLHAPGKHFLVQHFSTLRFAPCAAHTLLPANGGGCSSREEDKEPCLCISRSLPSACVKEALQPEGASAPSTCCSLVRALRALHMVFVSLHFRGYRQVRLMDPPELEDLLYSLEMLKSLLHPVALNSTTVVHSVFPQP